uniref:NADH-ubiquinone oxidoreductase chain 6 n=1 Tax=Betta smaragdina TaxID=209228 RepID=A0A8B0JWH4_BETSM|nr:NADH dehydrogenase subunit 6 [Betta smaragdina]
MLYAMILLSYGLIYGLILVASNPSPYFGALGLVVVATVGSALLAGHGGSFLSLVFLLIYLGGMLVVFAYSAALAAEPFPEILGSWSVKFMVVVYVLGAMFHLYWFSWAWGEFSWIPVDELSEFSLFRGDVEGVALMYSSGGTLLIISAWVLLLTLFVVLELTRGLSRGTIRAV